MELSREFLHPCLLTPLALSASFDWSGVRFASSLNWTLGCKKCARYSHMLIHAMSIGEHVHRHTFGVFPPILWRRQLPLREHGSYFSGVQTRLRVAPKTGLRSGSEPRDKDRGKVRRGLRQPGAGAVEARLLHLGPVPDYSCYLGDIRVIQGVRLRHCCVEASFGFGDDTLCVWR